MADYRFTFSGFAAAEAPDPFGVWEAPAPDEKAVSAAGLTWRAALPDVDSGLDAILARTKSLERGEAYLLQADAELRATLETVMPAPVDRVAGTASYAFSVPAAENFHPQKQALRDTLSGFAALGAPPRQVAALEGAVAFGAPDAFAEEKERKGFQEAYRRWLAFVEQVKQLTSSSSNAETIIAGECIGLTRIAWDGDFETFWLPGLSALSREVHRQNVNLVLASRIALLRAASVIATGAGGLIFKAVVLPPGAQALLLPAAIRFIFDVMDALRDWEATQR
ncbi:MAG TPA: hypothetical protein PKZ84_03625 [Anaerolineae bacterium]|nr:hypothetical protein [Anaerolineae bacterium]HQI86009.1 hypothetical protein [Anaerolineae bacterium]